MKVSPLALATVLLLASDAALAKPSPSDRLVLVWQVQKDVTGAELKFMSQKGVNLIQSFNVLKWNEPEMRDYLDRAHAHDIGVVMTIGKFVGSEDGKTAVDRAGINAFITKWKSHPAIFAWHTFDEAGNPKKRIPAEIQEQVYELVKSIDPEHLVMISWNGTSPTQYACCFSEKAFDLLDLHAYVRTSPGVRQNRLKSLFLSHRSRRYPVIITLRASDGPNRPDMPPDGLREQYQFFFQGDPLTRNVGLYGWKLAPNRGISQVPGIMKQFKDLAID